MSLLLLLLFGLINCLSRTLGHSSAVVPNTLLCHRLSDCCRLCCQCFHKGRATNPGGRSCWGRTARVPALLPPPGQLAGQPSGGCRDRLSEHPPAAQVVQPALSCCGCTSAEGAADAALLLRRPGRAGAGWSCSPELTPHQSVSGHRPQRPSPWMSLLCCGDGAAKGPGVSSAAPANYVLSFSAAPRGTFLLHGH